MTFLRTVILFLVSGASGQAITQQLPGPQPAPGQLPPGMPPMASIADTTYRAACRVKDAVASSADSVPGAIQRGKCAAAGLVDASISSAAANFNGLLVTGKDSDAVLKGSTITLTGPGSNDFLGIGAGAMVVQGKLNIDNARIFTSGRVSPASVAAEGATLIVRNSSFSSSGGALPKGYKPHVGPGMMEPPPPLGLKGTARTHLSLSNSKTYFYDSTISADGWGVLSTDQAGGNLYLEANDSTVIMRGNGYGTYADIGARVVLNRTRINSGGVLGFIAGEASLEFDHVRGNADWAGVVIHSVMGLRPDETGRLAIAHSDLQTKGPVILVKSANALVSIDDSKLSSKNGVLIDARVNDDPNATKTRGVQVPGNRILIANSVLNGDINNTDRDRAMTVEVANAELSGAVRGVTLSLTGSGKWRATGDSRVVISSWGSPGSIDADSGVTISAITAAGGLPAGSVRLPGGGTLNIAIQ